MKLLDDIRHHLAALNSGQQQREGAVLLREAATALEKGRWISVSERLPEDGEWVWCYGPNRGCEVACISKYWDGWVSSDKKNLVAGAYTHWMPLPEPPECP